MNMALKSRNTRPSISGGGGTKRFPEQFTQEQDRFLNESELYFKRVNSVLSRLENKIDSIDNPKKIEFFLIRLKKVEEILNKKEKSVLRG